MADTTDIDLGILAQGKRGPVGPAPTLKAGTAKKVPAGQQPSIEVVGKDGNYTINVGLPQGDKGDKGDPGSPGNPGKTPVKGKDYYTDADKQELLTETKKYVDDAILNGKW